MPHPLPPNLNISVELKSFEPKHEMSVPEVYTDFYGISLIMQGDRKLITPNMISILRAGDIGFTTKYLHHRATFLTPTPYSRYLIKFTSNIIEHLLEKLQIKDINEFLTYPVYHFNADSQKKFQILFSNMKKEFDNYGKYSETILEGMLYELLLTVKREHIAHTSTDLILKNANEKILDAIYYIDSNFTQNPSIDKVASHVGFSPSHFSRLFKQNTDISYSAYLLSVKLQRAMSLLIHTSDTIEEISYVCGFSEPSYLCHVFKKHHNISPLNYRKLHQFDI